MVLRKTLASCAALALLAGLGATQAKADVQLSFLGGVFDFSGSGFTSSGGSTGTTFEFVENGGVTTSFGNTVSAHIILTGTLSGSATTVTGNGVNTLTQNLTGVTESIVSNGGSGNPFAAGSNLISVGSTSAMLSGSVGGNNLTFSLAGHNIFSSDYFNVSGAQNQTMQLTTSSALGLASVSNTYTGFGYTVQTGALGSFSATAHSNVFNSGTGPAVPEASTLIGLGGLVLGGGFFGLRRRKA
jgi:hypothetical protein